MSCYSYDASGNVLSKDIGSPGDFSLRYGYDAANRLISIDELTSVDPETTRPIKRFEYARANGGSDLRAGKMVLSKRYNWVDPVSPLVRVTGSLPGIVSQSYRYQGLDGRVSQRQTRLALNLAHYAFTTGFAYDQQGNVSTLTYPRCEHNQCAGLDPAREVAFSYSQGFLSAVPGYATSLDYQLGGMPRSVVHANNVTETITPADENLPRPKQITTTGVTTGNWDSGDYVYDGSGNIKQIGTGYFKYDKMSRLLSGSVDIGGALKTQTTAYDAFGNITALTTDGATLTTTTATAINRLTALSATFDKGGNLTRMITGGVEYQYTYDPLNMMKYLVSDNDQARVFLYDADDERSFTFDCAFVECATQTSRLGATIRSLDGKVLRSYNLDFGELWDWQRDYIYRNGQPLATVAPQGTFHLHLDHLGSPRQITDDGASEVAFHTYYPFGGEATDPGQDEVRLKFTGHERDENGSSGPGMLDYMHARYYSPGLGRFLSVDPRNRRAAAGTPQRFNRYSYAAGNPLKYRDPDGEELALVFRFETNRLTAREQGVVAQGVRQRFVSAGVKNVQIVFPGGSVRPRMTKRNNLVVLTFTDRRLKENKIAHGRNAPPSNKAEVSTKFGPADQGKLLTFLSNVGAHEAAHATRALSQYDSDSRSPGSMLNPRPAREGFIMEQGVDAETLGSEIRYFSPEDAIDLQSFLNESPAREE